MPRYVIYARKSSESEERQVLSIDSQIRELQDVARSQGLEIASVLSESRSAKAPGRQVFGKVLDHITNGEVDGILCWKLDRLARNPVDGGAIIWALDERKLHQIVTPQRTFVNTGNDKFWMQLEFGMAKKYVDDLSDNVKRGNRAKLEQGWLPGLPPVGYRNDPVKRSIVADPDRFPLVKKMWHLVLSGTSVPKVLAIANDDWGFRTRKYKRVGNRPLSRTTLYKLLSNPFYYGLIVRRGVSYPGAHEPMVTKDEFDRVQELLGRPQRPHLEKHRFAYTGLIRCGECGAGVTAEKQVNRQGHRYTYYHCTKRRRGKSCSQGFVRVEALEKQIADALARIRINDDYRDWAIAHLRSVHHDESVARQAANQSVHSAYNATMKQIAALVDLRLRRLVTDEEYAVKRQNLVTEQVRLKERFDDADDRASRWLELTERAFVFANEAKRRFEEGSLEDKREILVALGSNLTLKDRNLRIRLQKPFRIIEESLQTHPELARPFEPEKNGLRQREISGRVTTDVVWSGLVDRVRTFFDEHPTLVQWPRFCSIHKSKVVVKSTT